MWLQTLCALLVLWLSRILWRRWKYDLHKIPSPPGLPFVGHLLDIAKYRDKGGIARARGVWLEKMGYPRFFKINIMSIDVLFIWDPDYVKNTLMSRTASFPKTSEKRFRVTMFTGNNGSLRTLSNETEVTPYVKEARKIYGRATQSQNLREALPRLQTLLDVMIKKIESKRHGGPIDFQEICIQLTADTIGVVALNTNLGGLDETGRVRPLLIETGRVFADQNFKLGSDLYRALFPYSSYAQGQDEIIDGLTAEWDALTKKILAYDDPPAGEEPIWYSLRTMIDPETGKKLGYEELRSEIALVVLAGMDSTGHQLGWIFAALASHPRVVAKILEELKSHGLYGAEARSLQFDDLGELSYLIAVIKEGMRLLSVVPASSPRVTPEDMTILGYRVPKNTTISVVGNRFLNSVEDWGDPKVFRPERWLEEDTSSKWFQGFSYGPRDCAGQKMAVMEMKTTIIEIITRFQLSMPMTLDQLIDTTKYSLFLEAGAGIWIDVKARESDIF